MAYTSAMQKDYGCISKRAYTTYAAANKAARFTRNDGTGYVEPYYCKYCGKFHVGGRPPEVAKMLTKRKPQYVPTIEGNLRENGIDPSEILVH